MTTNVLLFADFMPQLLVVDCQIFQHPFGTFALFTEHPLGCPVHNTQRHLEDFPVQLAHFVAHKVVYFARIRLKFVSVLLITSKNIN